MRPAASSLRPVIRTRRRNYSGAAGDGSRRNRWLHRVCEPDRAVIQHGRERFLRPCASDRRRRSGECRTGPYLGRKRLAHRSVELAMLFRELVFEVQSQTHPYGNQPPRWPTRGLAHDGYSTRPAGEPADQQPWPALVGFAPAVVAKRRIRQDRRTGTRTAESAWQQLARAHIDGRVGHDGSEAACGRPWWRRLAVAGSRELREIRPVLGAHQGRPAASVMTAFTTYAVTKSVGSDMNSAVAWPPRRRHACWCDSGEPYQRCCAAQAGHGQHHRFRRSGSDTV